MITEPIHVSDETYEKAVLQSSLPVIVDFWAPWCGPCKMVGPLLDDIAKDYADKLVVAKVNTDENSERAISYNVQTIPTLLFIKNGEVLKRHSGSLSFAALREMVENFLAIG